MFFCFFTINWEFTGYSLKEACVKVEYDIKTGEKKVVTKGMIVNVGAIKDNTIVISIQKPGEDLEDDLLIYDLDADKLSKLIYKDNEIYKGYIQALELGLYYNIMINLTENTNLLLHK